MNLLPSLTIYYNKITNLSRFCRNLFLRKAENKYFLPVLLTYIYDK